MKRHLTQLLTVIFVAFYVPAKSSDNLPSAQSDNEQKAMVYVDNYARTQGEQYEYAFTIVAQGVGSASTLDSAKMQAFENLLPELIYKTGHIGEGMVEKTYSIGGIARKEGMRTIRAENIHIKEHWIQDNGVYQYIVELYIAHSSDTEKS